MRQSTSKYFPTTVNGLLKNFEDNDLNYMIYRKKTGGQTGNALPCHPALEQTSSDIQT